MRDTDAGVVRKPGAWWRTVLVVAGSAALGGTAVALWNRRTLTKIQEHSPARSRTPFYTEEAPSGDEDF